MIVVLGSLNMDFLVRVEHLPAPGETVLGSGFETLPGGKGANQAHAAGKLGAAVRMLGCVGRDVFGEQLKASLTSAGVDVSGISVTEKHPTGVALISVDRAGQNSIVVASGANHALHTPSPEAFRGARVALFQLETPLGVVREGLECARAAGAVTILDPAPAQPLSRDLLGLVDILTPNETEALLLLSRRPGAVALAQAEEVARAVHRLGVSTVVLKLGAQGCFAFRDGAGTHYPGFVVDARDTTAAGDTFNAGLAVGLAEGRRFEDSVRFANAAAAVSVTRAGAQASSPSRGEVEALPG